MFATCASRVPVKSRFGWLETFLSPTITQITAAFAEALFRHLNDVWAKPISTPPIST